MDIEPLKQILLPFVAVLPRILALFAVFPVLGRELFPGLVRRAVAVSLSLVLFPVVSPGIVEGALSSPTLLAAVIGKEVVLGLLMGYLAGVVFWVAESVGFFIDNQRGATIASVFNPLSGAQTSPTGSLLFQLTAVLFFTGGGFLLLLSALFESYRIWPVFSFFPRFQAGFSGFFLGQADRIMELTVLLGGPVIIALFASELGLGLISRFAPQLNVFFLSMPVKSGIAVLLLALYLGFLVSFFREEFAAVRLLPALLGGPLGAPQP